MNVINHTKHMETKKKLKNIAKVEEFEKLLASRMITDEEKKILKMIYKERKSLSYIADILGYSESYVKKMHISILEKLF